MGHVAFSTPPSRAPRVPGYQSCPVVCVTCGASRNRRPLPSRCRWSFLSAAACRKKWSRQVSTLARCRCVGFSHVIGCRELPELVNAGGSASPSHSRGHPKLEAQLTHRRPSKHDKKRAQTGSSGAQRRDGRPLPERPYRPLRSLSCRRAVAPITVLAAAALACTVEPSP